MSVHEVLYASHKAMIFTSFGSGSDLDITVPHCSSDRSGASVILHKGIWRNTELACVIFYFLIGS